MSRRESAHLAEARWAQLALVQEEYRDFAVFLHDVMELLGFSASDIQEDIGYWMVHGPNDLMVQAQRGQAKTTIAAAFAVWCLIHSPAHRILIVSAAGQQANDISTLIVRIIMTMDVLECLRPDRNAGDRASTENFDVHHSLKGVDKSPSVASVGVDSNLQGKRADLLIADDVESTKNSLTAAMREKLAHIAKDFSSICNQGRILYLGTPQTQDSIYNSLPAHGVAVRIWPGRYPTPDQLKNYGNHLAPLLARRIKADPSLQSGGGVLGDQGQPIDPSYLGEEVLQRIELNQGTPYFQLQHMLSTALSDALRYTLTTDKLIVVPNVGDLFPMSLTRGLLDTHVREFSSANTAFKMRAPGSVSPDTSKLVDLWAYIDPAAGGANGDETAWAIGGFLNGNVYVRSVGGIPGGYELDKLEVLAQILGKFPLAGVTIEKNMGYGAFRAVFQPILRKVIDCAVEDDLVTGQKELRIVQTLGPVMGRGSLILEESCVDEDNRHCARYDPQKRAHYSLFYQLNKMTTARGAVPHDDRADALEGLVRRFTEALAVDQEKEEARKKHEEWKKHIANPLQIETRALLGPAGQKHPNILRHRRRR